MILEKCICCNSKDESGLIVGLCTDCYDLYLDIGKADTEEKKKKIKDFVKRKVQNA